MRRSAFFLRGQAAVILTLGLPTIIATAAFGTDIGMLYFNWLQLQKTADAAVVAGAAYLPSNPAVAISIADTWASKSGIPATEIISTRVGADDRTLTILFARKVRLLTSVLGFGSPRVTASATAEILKIPMSRRTSAGLIQASTFERLSPVTAGRANRPNSA